MEELHLRARLEVGAIDLEQRVFQRDHQPPGCPLSTQLVQFLLEFLPAALLDALGLRDRRLLDNRVNVIRRNVEDLFKLPQCFWEKTTVLVGQCVLGQQ